jgi:lipopolysaccharide export system ATP-binding protein
MSGRLEAVGLRRAYAGRRVVDGVDIAVAPGEIVGLLGPNGAGKTTCFGMIAGLVRPDAGTVRLAGQTLDGLPLWRRAQLGLGYMAQGPTVFRALTVRENVAIVGATEGAPDADALLETVGLSDRAADRAATLSGGERRRLEIARCLAIAPRFILLDEPFSGVDPVGVEGLQQLVRSLSADGVGVLLTDHAVREALGVCDRAIILDVGRVIIRGIPTEVSRDPHVQARYLGTGFSLDKADISTKLTEM